MERFDIAVIGSGPAGLEAAICGKLRNKNVLLLGDASLSNVKKAPEVLNYLGLGRVTGVELAASFLAHLKTLNINIVQDRVQTVYALSNYFLIQGKEKTYEASSIIIATGLCRVKDIKGEEQFLGNGVSYCPTCDGFMYKGKDIGVICYSKSEESEINFLNEIASNLVYFPRFKDHQTFSGVKIKNDQPLEIRKEGKKTLLITNKETYIFDVLFILKDSVNAKTLVPGLEMDGVHIKVDKNMKTNIVGLFACGDAVGEPYQYIKAAGEGNIASLSAVKYLDKK